MLHLSHWNICNQRNRILIVFQSYLHIILIDNHVFRNYLDDILSQMLHYLRGYIGMIMNQYNLEAIPSDVAGGLLFSAKQTL